MEVIDAQISSPQLPVPWEHGDKSLLTLGCELAREAMDSVGVDAGLIHGTAEFSESAYRRYPDRFGGSLPLHDKDLHAIDLEDRIAGLRSHPGMLALRAIVRSWTNGELTKEYESGAYNRVFAFAEKYRVPIFVQAAGYLSTLYSVVETHPNLTLILDHCGLNQQPSLVTDNPWEQLPEVIDMAKFPNVAIKLTGVVTLSKKPYPYEDVWPHLHKMVKAFGPQRIMWGSDFVRMRFAPRSVKRGVRKEWYGIYSNSVNFLRDTNEFSQADKEQMFSGTIRRLLNWPKAEVKI